MVIINQNLTEDQFRTIARVGYGIHPIADLCSLALSFKYVKFLGSKIYFLYKEGPVKLNGHPPSYILKAMVSEKANLLYFESCVDSAEFNQLEAFNKMIELEIIKP